MRNETDAQIYYKINYLTNKFPSLPKILNLGSKFKCLAQYLNFVFAENSNFANFKLVCQKVMIAINFLFICSSKIQINFNG